MEKKKILISGATGFIGRNTAEHLSLRKDFEVYGTYFNSEPSYNFNINWIKADLREKLDVENAVKGKDIIVQMAATTSGVRDITERPYIHITDNAVMNSLLLRSAFDNNISHFIFPSCNIMYKSSNQPIKETDFNPNQDIFPDYFGASWTKIYIEKMCEFFSGLGKTKHTVFRHSNVYGPHDKYNLKKSHVFGATIAKVMNAKEGEAVKVWGEGTEKRDLLYVDDVVSFIETAIDKQTTPYELVNVGLGKSISVKDLVKKIIDISGKNLTIIYDPSSPSIKTNVALDSTKAKQIFGWEPKISLEDGIKKTLRWYNTNIK